MKKTDCSLLFLVVMIVVDMAFGEIIRTPVCICADLAGATALLLHTSRDGDENRWYYGCLVALSIGGAGSAVAGWLTESALGTVLLAVTSLALMCVNNAIAVYDRMRNGRFFYRSGNIWKLVEDYTASVARMICALYCCLVASFSFMEGSLEVVAAIAMLLAGVPFYCWQLNLLRKGKLMFVPDKSAALIRVLLRDAMKDTLTEMDEVRMSELFRHLEEYMDESKPFLDPTLTLSSLAEPLMTNRTYLSQTINFMYGKNFRSYLNTHRIRYAECLMLENPKERIQKIAYECGFNTVPSFNLAFKLMEGVTPTEWLELKRRDWRHPGQ